MKRTFGKLNKILETKLKDSFNNVKSDFDCQANAFKLDE